MGSQFTTDFLPDELIKLYKSVVEINADANTALSRATKNANDGLSDFSLAVQMFKRQLMHDLEISSSETQSYFEKLVKGMDSAIQSTISKMSSVIRAAETDAANMSEVSPSRRSQYFQKRADVCLSCGRMFVEPMSILPIWRRILEESFSRSLQATQSWLRLRSNTAV